MMEWIYWSISWILMKWHWLWEHIIPGGAYFLGTNWDWILAIVFLVITVRIILFPIFVKQIRSQRAMQALQPKMKELQAKYKGDQQTLREEMMKLYQTEKVNPLMGCLPMFLQIPVFLGLFHVLSYLNPLKEHDPNKLYGWTTPLFDSASHARIFGAPIPARFADGSDLLASLDATSMNVKIVAGVLVLVMMFTTFMSSRQMILKTGWNPDPQQRMIQKLMLYGIPFSLLLSGWYFPIGVIVYWVTQNIFTFCQQYWVLHKYPPPVTAGAVPATRGIFARIPPAPGTKAAEVAAKRPSAPTTRPSAPPKPAQVKSAAASTAKALAAGEASSTTDETVDPTPAKATPSKAPAAKATPAKSTAAKAAPAKSNGAPAKSNGAPAQPTAAKAKGSGFVNPVQEEKKVGGLFRRKPEAAAPATPAAEPSARAPKPGAKPATTARKKQPANKKGGAKR